MTIPISLQSRFIKKMTNEEIIWNYLYEKLKNVYGVAALMGNLMAESSLNPLCANGVKKLGLTNQEYTHVVDQHKNDNFVTDGIAYGLVQWCYKTRKQGLLNQAVETNKSVGDIYLQLDYMWQELQAYKTVLNALYDAKDVRTASDIVMLKYEKPANKTEIMKERRAAYGEKFLKKYGNNTIKFNIDLGTARKLFDQLSKLD